MGYTHYWSRAPELPAGAFRAAVSDCQKTLAHPMFVIIHEGGDNNMFDSFTNRRSRSWYLAAAGNEWEILQEACEWARGCCGGCVKIGGRHTDPETFIRRYRRAMKEALTVQVAVNVGIHLAGRIKVRTKPDNGQWKLDQLTRYGILFSSKPDDVVDGTTTHECSTEFDLRVPGDFNVWFDATHGFKPPERMSVSCSYLREHALEFARKNAHVRKFPEKVVSLKVVLGVTPQANSRR